MSLLSRIAGLFGISLPAVMGTSCLLAALASGILVHRYDRARFDALSAQRDSSASHEVAAANARTLEAERAAHARATTLEISAHERQAELDRTLAENRRLAARAGGLHDPGRKPADAGRVSGSAAPACPPADAASDGRLSAEATEFLLELAADADRAAIYARTGHGYAVTLTPGVP